jgi:peptidyl-prolyl cis-trans isomerase C
MLFLQLFFVGLLAVATICHGFQPMPSQQQQSVSRTQLGMGLFDGLKKAFENADYSAPPEGVKASARHILVKTEPEAKEILSKLGDGSNFASLAQQFSSCPSGARGGSLGSFAPGTMVPAFDAVIFDPKTNLGEVVGPVKTNFGYHLIVVDKRTGVE